MYRLALKMLIGDRAKYLSLVLGLAFAVLLITQQSSIFFGLLRRGTGILQNIRRPHLWVADEHTPWINDLRPMNEDDLLRIRSVPGVAWAEPVIATRGTVELPNGSFQAGRLIGIDRSSLIGRPPRMIKGDIADLRRPDAVIVEQSSLEKLGGVDIGDRVRLNDRRAIIVGIAQAELSFQSNVLMYTTFDNAIGFVPQGRDKLSLVLVRAKSKQAIHQVKRGVNDLPGLRAFTHDEFQRRTINYILAHTGIGINFGVTVTLGFIVGLVVVGAALYQFTLENLRQFAVLKAMGATRGLLVRLILVQASVVGLVSFGIGVGAAGAFSMIGRKPGSELSTYFPWQLLVGSLIATLLCVFGGSLLSVRRVLRLDPAMVFK